MLKYFHNFAAIFNTIMFRAFSFAILIFYFPILCAAQVMEGIVTDNEQKLGLPGVFVSNIRTGLTVQTSDDGYYTIQANGGDSILFRHLSFYTDMQIMKFASNSYHNSVSLQPLVHGLKEATILGISKYQQDSIANHRQFEHELTKVIVPQPKMNVGLGFGCSGCIGWLADKLTGNSKKLRRFKNNFATEDGQRFIDSRYTGQLVAGLTGLNNPDTIASFIYNNPMDYSFARTASDLELKAWIRNAYKAGKR